MMVQETRLAVHGLTQEVQAGDELVMLRARFGRDHIGSD